MKRILFFETPEFTGATRVTRAIAKTLRDQYEEFFAVVNPNSESLKDCIRQQVHLHHPDILFSSFVSINPDVIEVGKAMGLTVVIRTNYKFSDISQSLLVRIKETYPLADQLVAQTDEMAEELRSIEGVQPQKVIVLENPLDKEEILRKSSEPNPFCENGNFHFLWVGREDPIKDVETLKKAFQIVKDKYPNTDLSLVTNDENPYRWIRNADCLVISSKSEASPNVLREALFLGTPVVSTDCSPTVKQLLSQARIARVSDPLDLSEKMIMAMNEIKENI